MKSWLINSLLAVAAVFAPAKELFIATGVLIIADLITGVMAARKSGKPITSAGLRRSVSKMLIYNLAVGSGFLVQHYMMGDLVPVSNIVSSAIGLTELKSIMENIGTIQGGSLFKSIVDKLGSVNDAAKKDSSESEFLNSVPVDNKPEV